MKDVKGDTIDIFDLLKEAEQAEQSVIHLPDAVKVQLSGYNKSRLKMLTFSNIVALADWASKYPERWEILKLHYLNPGLSSRDIALCTNQRTKYVDAIIHTVNFIDPNEYWQMEV